MHLFQVILTIVCSAKILTAYRLHEELSPEERLHYFGTQLVDEVPDYHFTSPEPIQRRRRSADDGTEYIVDLFGEATHLLLDKNTDLISPGCVVHHLGVNGTRTVYPCSNEIDCFYTGRTSNHSDSWVSASICGGLHGVIGTTEKTFMVQPIRREHAHRLRRDTSVRDTHIVTSYRSKRACVDDKKGNAFHSKKKAYKKRKRRTPAKRTIETSVVVEPEVVKFHGNGTEQFVKTVMNVAAGRFLDPSLQNKLYMTLNKVVILENIQAGLTLDEDATITLDSFCEWQSTWNEKDDKNPNHADYVLLLTRLDLKHHGNAANSGLARKGMCGEKTKCSINEDIGLGSGFIIAHETGHVLGMSHDGVGNACANDKNIMSALAASGPDAFKWSQCSADTLKRVLRTSELNCLDDRPPGSAIKSYETKTQPGTIYTANQQCKLMLGPTAEVCDTPDGQDVCGSIICRPKPDTGVNGCVIYSSPRMDGTDCGNRHWCKGGRCVAMTRRDPGQINGGWSAWSTLSACSRSCGGGVRVKRRYCNNPEPQYGGFPCSGSDSMAELCNVPDCPTSQETFKAEQCAATDGDPIRGHTYHWIPNTGALGDDSCEKSCQAQGTNWYSKRGINIDGTECISDQMSTLNRCVTGKCKNFGCDGHMDSGKNFDQCAVCDGAGNTCTKVSGTFKSGGKERAFTTFVTLPIGSTGITITQGNGYCFLNIKVDGHNLFTASAPRSSGTFVVGGVKVKYNKNPERIYIIGPTKSYIQAQVYRQYGSQYVGVDPDVYYEYHKPKSGISTSTYMWKTQAGTCSKQCGTGSQVPVVTCVNANSRSVDDKFCNLFDKPKEDAQSCNTHACPPRWRTGDWQACSKICGGGTKRRSVECVEENRNIEKVLSASRCHSTAKPTASAQCNTDACPGSWRAGAWSACSETCARGTRTRDVKCYASSTSSTVVADSVCSGSAKPETTEYCVVKPCRTDITGASCVDKVADCFKNYGEGVCNGQYKGWASTNCMKSCGVCSTVSATDANCQDKILNCASYQAGFCTNSAYKAWAANNCKRHCGLCGPQVTTTTTTTPPPSNPNCIDKKDNCAAYGKDVCTGQYAAWAKDNCKRFCNQCELTTQPTIQQADDADICVDRAAVSCDNYGRGICSNRNFSLQYCRKYCDLCPSGACQDKINNCAQYQANMCTDYKPWATENCKAHCNLCGTRRKRDVPEVDPIAPPEPELAPPLLEEPPLASLKLMENDVPVQKREPLDDSDETTNTVEDEIPRLPDVDTATKKLEFIEPEVVVEKIEPIDDSVEETESLEPDVVVEQNDQIDDSVVETEYLEKDLDDLAQEDAADVTVIEGAELGAPDLPVCNTVLTTSSGSVDVRGEVEPGVVCEQVIAMPLDSRVSVEFTNLDSLDCGSGDTLTVTDIMTDVVTDLCATTQDPVWFSSGSIVVISFMPSMEGRGFSFTYQSLPQNISGCSQHLTAAYGTVEPIKAPPSGIAPYDKCEIYITGTPSKNIQLAFMEFLMPGNNDNCVDGEGIMIENLVGGDRETFCGEHQPFIWESRGSIIKITYSPLDDASGFSAKYSMQDN